MRSQTVARRYAQALVSLGQENNKYQDYREKLKDISLLFEEANAYPVLSSPIYPHEIRKNILETVLKRLELDTLLANFIRLLLDKNRFALLGLIATHYGKLVDEIDGLKRATLITATPITDQEIEEVVKSLEKFTKSKINISVRKDPELIGGIIVTMGDLTIDGSVKTQLKNLTRALEAGA